jgi:hypothetical protein
MTYSEEQLNDLRNAVEAIHPIVCEARHQHNWNECRTSGWLMNAATIDAITHLRNTPRDAAGARIILHNAVCMSGCVGESATEHAKRQTKPVTALRKYLAGAL